MHTSSGAFSMADDPRDSIEDSYRARVLRIRLRIGRRSEIESQRELQVPLTVSGAAAALGEYFAERREVVRVEARAVPVGVIPDVEGLRAELKTIALGEWEALEEAHVPILEARRIEDIANPLGVECSGGWRTEDSLINPIEFRAPVGTGRDRYEAGLKPLPTGAEGFDQAGIAVLDPILAVIAATEVGILADAGEVPAGLYRAARSAGLILNDAANLPVAESLAEPILASMEEGELVQIISNENMAYIKLGMSP